MAELINTNVFDANKKFVDLSSLDYFWDKAKGYIDGVDASMSEKVTANEDAIKAINAELETISGGVGSVGTQINEAIAALKLAETYEAKGDAAKAETAAKAYADEKNTAMDTRVKVLEAINHEELAADAAAAAVAGVIDGAPEKFDTLKEVAQWIADSETAAEAADLVTRVSALEGIDHEAYKGADEAVLTSAKAYADGLAVNYEAAGAAATAAATAKSEAIADADGKLALKANAADVYVKDTVDTKVANAQAAAIAQAKLDAAEALKGYYTKTEVDNLLSTNSTGDRAYAKQYTDELFGSFQFAANSDIDALFA